MAGVRRQTVKLLLSPLLYFAGLLPAVVVALTSMRWYGDILYRYVEPLYRYDNATPGFDELALALILVTGVLVFGLFDWVLVLFERLERPPTRTDHLRRCACLYVLFVILSAVLTPEHLKAYQLPGYPPPEDKPQIVWLLVGCAILVDAIVLMWRRSHRTIAGDAA